MAGVAAAMAGIATQYMGTALITVGADTSVPGEELYGWFNGNANGSDITPDTFAATGVNFNNLWWIADIGTGVSRLLMSVNGVLPNSGWEVLRIGSTSFARSSASYSSTTTTTWFWNGVSNPFGTTVGAGVRATWT